MFHTAQTDMADSYASTLASDAHRRAVLTAVLADDVVDPAAPAATEDADGRDDRNRATENVGED